ncbi:ureidoglycolate lyase [Ahrensia kielensis]|uniref:ureidoglycolate lyase n=1 Tax=Ahrensia kielensis TaxID=76980 RepID=UPI00036D7999|nr:ureidoglycolate lyase [Ahrensia kielensis]
MSEAVLIQDITHDAFAPFGDLVDISGEPDKIINQGLCGRYHDRAHFDFGPNCKGGLSLFNAEPRSLPYALEMVERHPLCTQAFIPLHQNPFLVIVAEGNDDTPGKVHAFITKPGQAINFHRNTWHGVLTPLSAPGQFAVIDRVSAGDNLQEYWFDEPKIIAKQLVRGTEM